MMRPTPAVVLAALLSCAHGQWGTSQLLNEASYSGQSVKDCHLAARHGGGFHAIYKTTTPQWVQRYRFYTNASSLSPSTAVQTLVFLGGTSSLAVSSPLGHLHVAWENWATAEEDIYAARSVDGGNTWQQFQVTDYGKADSGDAKSPVLTINDATDDSMLCHNWHATADTMCYNVFNASSCSYDGNVCTAMSCTNQYAVTAAVYSPANGRSYRFYSHQASGHWQLYMYAQAGAQVGPEIQVSDTTDGTFIARPAASVNSAGLLVVIWEEGDLLYRVFDTITGAFASPAAVFEKGNYASITSIPGSENFYATYADTSNKVRPHLLYATGMPQQQLQYDVPFYLQVVYGKHYYSGNNTWQAAEVVSNGLGIAYTLATDVVAGEDGRIYACWEFWGNGQAQQYYNERAY